MQEFKENYLNQNERMNPQLENVLKSNTTDLADNPAFPKTDANGNPINFLELIAYKRFLEVVERVKRYTNLTNVTGQAGMSRLTPMLMQGVNFIEQVEQPHKLALENLAVDLVVEEMEIPDDVFQFQCKIVNRGEINQDGFQKETKQPSEEEINKTLSNEAEAENMTPSEFFEMEKHKRRFINMLIQGSSKKGHYMFELVRNKLNEYNPNLAKSYGEVMSINDLIYWLLDDETINQMASQPSAMAGKEEIEQSEDGTIIKTEAICFPVSLHEIIKGVMETFGTQGLPDDPQQANMLIDAVDSLSNETMDLRLGAIIWEKFINAYPRMVFDEGNRYLQHYLFSRFCGLETTEFFRVARMIMANDPKGAKYMERMTDEIISDLNVDEFEENQDDNEDDINIDDLFNYKKGGVAYVDLFEDYENIPANVQKILDEYDLEEDSDYDTLLELQNRLETIGYTFEYGLDAVPYGLRPSNVKLNQLEGYENEEYAEGGEAGFDIYDFDKKMALINLGQVYEYAIKLDKMIKEDTDLEEWVKMKLTRIEQNIADVKHSLEGWEKYEDGGEIPKKQLLHIAKYSKDLIEMIQGGSKLMSWQEDKLAISSASIDDIYHHLDYEMGNRAEDLDVDDEYRRGGFVSKGELVWKKLSSSDKIDFLYENFTPQITPTTQQTLTGKAYNFLPKNVKIVLESKYANVEEYKEGGEVQEWMEKALQSLIEETGNNNLQIFYVKENDFTCQDDDGEEYRVFKNEDLAYDYAVEEVESDMEYQPENFNRDFLMEYIKVDDLFVDSFENINYDYTKDIQSEKSEKYENRLIEELVANGLISEEEAQTRSSKELDEEYTQDYIDLLTSEQIGDDNGITHFIDNFGENEFFELVYENNLIDVEDASKKAVEIDGIAHFLAGYDGETIYLDNNIVAYRTN
jgi:hypothetical protein